MIRHSPVRGTLMCCGVAALIAPSGATLPQNDARAAPLVIGVVLPEQDGALRGVQLGAAEAERTAQLLRETFALHIEHAADSLAAAAAARRLVRTRAVHVIIGGADAAAARMLMSFTDSAGVLFINVGAADDALRELCSASTLHVVPSTTMRARALELAAAGDSAAAWHDSLERYGAGQVNDRYRARFGGMAGEREWAGWMAVKVAWESAQRAPALNGSALLDYATGDVSFDGHKGLPLSFQPRTHQLRQPVYVLSGDVVIAEMPAVRDDPDVDPAALLDRLAPVNESAACDVH